MCLPARVHVLQDIEDAGLHVVEFMFASCGGNRENQLGTRTCRDQRFKKVSTTSSYSSWT